MGIKNITTWDKNYAIGQGIHEMGSARMGRDPKTSVLNAHNQLWDAKNVFVTDGACMLSSACQNPSRTGRGFRGERNEERKYLIFSGLGFYSTPTGIY